MDVDHLAQIAAQLTVRVRDEDPEANGRWLTSQLPDPADWFRLTFVLAAAVPDDQTWRQLTSWTRPDEPPGGCGTPTGYSRHIKNGEKACDPCREAERLRGRNRRALAHTTRLEIAA